MKQILFIIVLFTIFSCSNTPPKDYRSGEIIVERISYGGKQRTTLYVKLIDTGTAHSIYLGRRTKYRLNCEVGDTVQVKYYHDRGSDRLKYDVLTFLK